MTSIGRIAVLASTIIAGSGLFAAQAAPTNYGLLTTIAIPGSSLFSFDISYVDPVTGIYYVADRSDASVDIINGATNKVIGAAGGFVGAVTVPPSTTVVTARSGPDGVVVVDNGTTATLYAGDGGSTLRSFNVTNPSTPIAGGTVNTGGGVFRVDEMAYSPTAHTILAANNANSPAFASIISTSTALAPTITAANIPVPGQTAAAGGLEASVWDPNTGTFFVSVPTFNGTDPGGVAQFSATGTAINTYSLASLSSGAITSCSPAGIVVGASGNLTIGCGNSGSQTVVLNPTANAGAGSIVRTLSQVSGSDEIWFDPTSGNVFVNGVNAAGDRVIDIFSDSTGALLQSIDLTAIGAGTSNLHSLAVDPLNEELFVPITGSSTATPNTLCPGGCVAVFALNVPEPASLPLTAAALAGMVGMSRMMRRRS